MPPGLLERLDLTSQGDDRFTGTSAEGFPRVYGGEAAAQAFVAAGRTVDDDRVPHSIQCHYLLVGDPARTLEHTVERTRDGRSFSTRRVVTRQGDDVIAIATVSFQRADVGPVHQVQMPDAPAPESLRTPAEAAVSGGPGEAWITWSQFHPYYEMRVVPPDLSDPTGRRLTWGRFTVDPPDDRGQAALAVFASDFSMISSIRLPHEPEHRQVHDMATLSHSLHLHAPFRSTQWHLVEQSSPAAGRGRGLSISHVFTHDGELVATGVQEGLVRPRRAP